MNSTNFIVVIVILALGLSSLIESRELQFKRHAGHWPDKHLGHVATRLLAGRTRSTGQADPSQAVAKFASKLWRKIICHGKSTSGLANNTIMSPISVHQALSMVALGADKGGHSRKELLKALSYDDPEKAGEDYKKLLAEFRKLTEAGLKALEKPSENRRNMPPVIDIWSTLISVNERKYKKSYLEATKNYYNSTPELIAKGDMKAYEKVCDKVNKWAKEAGFGDKVLTVDQLTKDPNLAGVLLTAIRFQAAWFEKFKKQKGKDIFYNHGSKDKLVKEGDLLTFTEHKDGMGSYMEFSKKQSKRRVSRKAHLSDELSSLEFKTVDVPLEDELWFTIIQPMNGTLDKLTNSMTKADDDDGRSALQKLIPLLDKNKYSHHIKRLTFPAFKFESSLELVEPLKKLGLERMFDKSRGGQLEAVMGDPKLFVSNVKHQAMVETSEFGIRAAAITKVDLATYSRPIRGKQEIDIKHPFMFLIRHKTTLLFVGQLVEL